MLTFKKWPIVLGLLAMMLLTPPQAFAGPACVPEPLTALPPPIRTVSTVTTRSGSVVSFTADAGLLRVAGGGVPYGKTFYSVPKDDDGPPPTATMSYYFYAAMGKAAGKRPLIFVWDGGPGASTRPMLMDSFGPIALNAPGDAAVVNGQPTQPLRQNRDTLLDVADLVFVDAPGTGFGKLDGCKAARGFYGVDVDAAAFQRFIEQFVHTYHREGSPTVLFGASYGTIRAAVVAKRLQDAGTPVAGVVLVSQLLSLDAWSDGSKANVGTENAFFLTLPSFAATAWSHGKVSRSGDLETWMHDVERFSLEVYGPALLQGANLSPDRKQTVAETLARYTGLSAKTWLDENLRIEGSRFRDLLLAKEGRIVGREDTRVDGPVPKIRGTATEDDPTPPSIRAVSREAFKQYVRGTLGLGSRTFAPYIDGTDTRWDMHHLTDPGAWPDTYFSAAPDLVAALKGNDKLHVLVVGGYFDLAAPYLGASYLISQLPVSDDVRRRIEWKAYPAPHDVYGVDDARRDVHDKVARLLEAAG